MPKKEYTTRNTGHEVGMPLFKNPYYGDRVQRLEGDVDGLYDRLEALEGRFNGLDSRLEEILRACKGEKESVSKTTPETNPEPKPEPRPEPVPVTKSEPRPEPKPAATTTVGNTQVHLGYAYLWWDGENRMWVPCTNIWAAKQAGGGVYHPVWAWLDGQNRLVRLLTQEEIRRYCP